MTVTNISLTHTLIYIHVYSKYWYVQFVDKHVRGVK